MARTMTQASQSRLPLLIWGEATAYSTYIQNKIPANKTKLSPFETWTGHKPDFSYLRILGSKAFVHIPDAKWTKQEQKCIEGILVVFFRIHQSLPYLLTNTSESSKQPWNNYWWNQGIHWSSSQSPHWTSTWISIWPLCGTGNNFTLFKNN